MTNNLGMLQISFECLGQLLNLPKGHTITAVVPPSASEIASQTFCILVSGPTLPVHYEGSVPPIVEMVRDGRGRMHFA